MRTQQARAGARAVDRDAIVTRSQAEALKAAGIEIIGRCVCHPTRKDQDASKSELLMITSLGLGTYLYGYFRTKDFSAETGAADALAHIHAAKDCAYAEGADLVLDIEGHFPDKQATTAYAVAWLRLVKKAGYRAVMYVGPGAPWTSKELAALGFDAYWKSAAWVPEPEGIGYQMIQSQQSTIAGVVVDEDVVQVDKRGGRPVVAVSDIVDSPDEAFTFTWRGGEDVNERFARCWEEALSHGRMGHAKLPTRYASFVNAGDPAGYFRNKDGSLTPVASIASWATSCMITEEAVARWCGWTRHAPINGEGFFEVFGTPHVKNDGKTTPPRGAILYWASNGVNGHVDDMLGVTETGAWRVAGGGGGADGTECSIYEHKSRVDSFGRPLVGWWLPSGLGLPESPPVGEVRVLQFPCEPLPYEEPPPKSRDLAKPVGVGAAVVGAIGVAAHWVAEHPWLTTGTLLAIAVAVTCIAVVAQRE